jgi:hypothetical protein
MRERSRFTSALRSATVIVPPIKSPRRYEASLVKTGAYLRLGGRVLYHRSDVEIEQNVRGLKREGTE